MKDVVVALIIEKGRVLTERRKLSNAHSPGKRRFPAGHVEKGEDLVTALKREVYEELRVEVTEQQKVYETLFHGEDGIDRRLHYFIIHYCGVLPQKSSLEWLSREEWEKMSFSEDQEVLKTLCRDHPS